MHIKLELIQDQNSHAIIDQIDLVCASSAKPCPFEYRFNAALVKPHVDYRLEAVLSDHVIPPRKSVREGHTGQIAHSTLHAQTFKVNAKTDAVIRNYDITVTDSSWACFCRIERIKGTQWMNYSHIDRSIWKYVSRWSLFLFQDNRFRITVLLITIVFGLEWTWFAQIEIVRLFLAHRAQTHAQVFQMSSGDFFVELMKRQRRVIEADKNSSTCSPSSVECKHQPDIDHAWYTVRSARALDWWMSCSSRSWDVREHNL